MANGLPTTGASGRNPRETVGTHYNTPVGNMASNISEVDHQSNTQVDGSAIQAARTKKLQFVSAELKRMRYF